MTRRPLKRMPPLGRTNIASCAAALAIVALIAYSCADKLAQSTNEPEAMLPPDGILTALDWRSCNEDERLEQASIWADILKPGASVADVWALRDCLDQATAPPTPASQDVFELAANCAVTARAR